MSRVFLTADGRLRPGYFVAALFIVYALWFAAHLLTAPAVLARAGLWPFALAQVLLIWMWFALHAKRLRDAGRAIAPAQGVAVIYALAVVLLLLVGVYFLDGVATPDVSMPSSLLALRELLELARRSLDVFVVLALIACASLLIVPIFSVWAALQPGRATDTA